MTLNETIPRIKPVLLAGLLALLPMQAALATDLLAEPATEAVAIGAVEAGAVESDAVEAEAVEAQPEGLRILDAAEVDPEEFLWQWRILAVMADTPNDPAFIQQMRDIDARANQLFERDVVVVVDTARASGSPLRQRLRPRGFMLAIIDKDGEVKQRRPSPRDVREISAVIDRFPLRRQEMLERSPGRN
jgi:hypothetical protein